MGDRGEKSGTIESRAREHSRPISHRCENQETASKIADFENSSRNSGARRYYKEEDFVNKDHHLKKKKHKGPREEERREGDGREGRGGRRDFIREHFTSQRKLDFSQSSIISEIK